MCLSTVYKAEKRPENLVLSNVQRIEDRGGVIVLTDLMDREVAIEGRIALADLIGGVVVIEEARN